MTIDEYLDEYLSVLNHTASDCSTIGITEEN